jgi:hypothetical protein
MSGLAFAQAPPPGQPLRFLLSSLAWGAGAGLWLLWTGETALLTRWAPHTLVLAHLFTLGVLGNAMIGSLFQFLPVAAGCPLSLPRQANWLHVALNAGLLLLLSSLVFPSRALAGASSVLLAPPLALFAVSGLIAVMRGSGPRAPRLGIGIALASLLVTIALGLALLAALSGLWALPLDRIANLHAALGLAGWALALLGAVASITMPMLQGTRRIPAPWLLAWLCTLLLALAWTGGAALSDPSGLPARALALPGLVFCIAVLVLQARAPHRRNPVLRRFWQAGCLALALACLLGLAPALSPRGLLALGALVIAIGLPLLVLGMLLEIVGFLAWIELRRRHPRGVRVPGVDRLLDDKRKQWLLRAHLASAGLLLLAIWQPAFTRVAGAALALAWTASGAAVLACWRDALRFRPRETDRST